jgi:colanic acid biosynthesis glycosyl transferase WcaI
VRILIVSQWFTPEPSLRGLVFAKALVARGHTVQVLTGFPNYPGGKVYPGYKIGLPMREVIEGIPVIRVPLYPSHDRSGFRRICNYVSFALSAAAFGLPMVKQADVIYAYQPPATIALPALTIGILRRIPVVYDIQDLWPDTLRATGMVNSPAILGLVGLWCKLTYRLVARITVLSPGFKNALVHRRVAAEKVEVLYNWCEEDKIFQAERNEALARQLGVTDKFAVIFAGTMGKAQGLETVLDAAELLLPRNARVQFVFIGAGIEVQHLKQIADEKGLKNVTFLPRRPRNEIGEILNLADVLLVHLRKDELFSITIPSKIQAYLAVGKPILVGVEGDAAALVQQARAGVAYDPGSALGLAEAVEHMTAMTKDDLAQMGEWGRRYYFSELCMDKGVDRFEGIFNAVTA